MSILISGPGEARGELRKRIDEKKIQTEEITAETAARMTEAQVVAKVSQFHASTIRSGEEKEVPLIPPRQLPK
jgi:hypothetical protein